MWRLWLIAGALLATAFAGQTNAPGDIGVGRLLIATKDLADPNFAETVILIVDYDSEKGASGLILNRRTTVALTKLFPDLKNAPGDPVYQGGPVEVTGAQALLRAHTKPENANRVFGDVYVTGSKDLIEKSVGASDPASFRLYVGYGGWGAGQLEREIDLGAWEVLNGKTSIVFDDDPDSLWSRLEEMAHSRIAMRRAARVPQRAN
jgi:putative transcriptional regulator